MMFRSDPKSDVSELRFLFFVTDVGILECFGYVYFLLEVLALLLWCWGFERFILKLSSRFRILKSCAKEILAIRSNERCREFIFGENPTEPSEDFDVRELDLLLEVPEFYTTLLKVDAHMIKFVMLVCL